MAWVQTLQHLERPVLQPGNVKPQNSDPSYLLLIPSLWASPEPDFQIFQDSWPSALYLRQIPENKE